MMTFSLLMWYPMEVFYFLLQAHSNCLRTLTSAGSDTKCKVISLFSPGDQYNVGMIIHMRGLARGSPSFSERVQGRAEFTPNSMQVRTPFVGDDATCHLEPSSSCSASMHERYPIS